MILQIENPYHANNFAIQNKMYEITVSFKGVNTSTGEAINYELKEHDY